MGAEGVCAAWPSQLILPPNVLSPSLFSFMFFFFFLGDLKKTFPAAHDPCGWIKNPSCTQMETQTGLSVPLSFPSGFEGHGSAFGMLEWGQGDISGFIDRAGGRTGVGPWSL